MAFEKLAQLTPELSASFHKVRAVTFTGPTVLARLTLGSYASRAEAEKEYGTILWQFDYYAADEAIASLTRGGLGLYEAAEVWVTTNLPMFQGARLLNTPDSLTDLEVEQAQKLSLLVADYDKAVQLLSEDYPEAEQKSWPIQVEEAKQYSRDPILNTPWLDAAVEGNEKDKEEFVLEILAKDSAYRTAYGNLTGVFQRERKSIFKSSEE